MKNKDEKGDFKVGRLEDWWNGYDPKTKVISYEDRGLWEGNDSFSLAS